MAVRSAAFTLHVAVLALVLLTVGLLDAATYRGDVASADEAYMFGVTHNLVEHHTIAVDDLRWLNKRVPGGAEGPGHHFYTKLGIGQPLMGIPLYLAGKQWLPTTGTASFAGYPVGPLSGVRGAMATGSVVGLFTVAGAYLLALLLGSGPRGATLAALGVGVGSMLWPYAKTYFSEPAATFWLVWAVVCAAWHGRRPATWKLLLAGLCLDAGMLVRPVTILVAAPIVLYAAWTTGGIADRKTRRRLRAGVASLVLLVGIGVAAVGTYNWARYGSLFTTGYGPNEGFSHNVLRGLWGFAVSPGKSLLLFDVPVVLAPFGAWLLWRRSRRPEVLLIGTIIAMYVLLYSVWWSWQGGWAWGPRFLLPVVPLLLALGAPAAEAAPGVVAASCVVLGGLVSLVGALYDPISAIGEVVGGGLPEARYPWSLHHAYLLVQARHVLRGDHPDSLFLAHHAPPHAWIICAGIILLTASAAAWLPAKRRLDRAASTRPVPAVSAVVSSPR